MGKVSKYFEAPEFLPTKFFIFLAGSIATLVLGTFYLALHVAEFDSRLTAQEQTTIRVNDDLKYRTTVNERIIERLNSIDRRLSVIEGKVGALK